MMKDLSKLESALSELLHARKADLRETDLMDIEEFISHRELGLAFDLFCACLTSEKLDLSEGEFKKMKSMARQMKHEDSRDWKRLEQTFKK